MTTPPLPPDIPPEQLADLVRTMQTMRDDLLRVSMLLRDYLYETDAHGREQARLAAESLIQQCRSD